MNGSTEKTRVLLGVTGSIAAYKSAELVRRLVTRGYEVRVAMSDAAEEFITPLTLSSVSGNPVVTGFWNEGDQGEIGHISLADWADVVVVAPASADFIAKARAGMAENPLLAICLATRAPILMAPAMNINMIEHPATRENMAALAGRGVRFIEAEEGALACGWYGSGRMAEPWEIFQHVLRALSGGDYIGKRVLVSTGPTREPIDPVRFVSNRSSGKMGVAIAREAFRRGAEVTLVHGPVSAKVPRQIRKVPVMTAVEMHQAMLEHAFPSNGDKPDVIIMTAAVSDFRVKNSSPLKMKASRDLKTLELEPNPDILMDLGKKRGDTERPLLVGFAVETGEIDELVVEASKKLKSKNADMIVGNFAEDAFDLDTNRVWLIDRYGKQEEVALTFKSRVANKILQSILHL